LENVVIAMNIFFS